MVSRRYLLLKYQYDNIMGTHIQDIFGYNKINYNILYTYNLLF